MEGVGEYLAILRKGDIGDHIRPWQFIKGGDFPSGLVKDDEIREPVANDNPVVFTGEGDILDIACIL